MKAFALSVVLGAALVAAQNHQVVYDPSLYQAANVNRQGAGGFLSMLGSGASGLMNTIAASLPNMLTNALPALAVLGLGGLLLPLLGVSLFLREGQKRTFSLPTINPAILEGIADVLDRVSKAIEQGEKKYGKN
ncbi:uncharacterized protein LOC111263175 isoform X2 [Varroa jacobsoni]|uniref:Uncharacterized protein n=1 Tax=Varroa destructor TaxID=109461 RepID=A0A7M7JTX3_VARDE|nr:uncharacterized protein LOC111248497 isoform X2 [Varroa destructor]XP_022693783.1 uncharacterized protein LOC111263175 isoform X2 [Varroa jacobsoni]